MPGGNVRRRWRRTAPWRRPPSIRPLLPQGLQTGDIESLTGVLTRMALHHSMAPTGFAAAATAEFSADGSSISRNCVQGPDQGAALNGLSRSGARLAAALEVGTGHAAYSGTRLGAWAGVIGRQGHGLIRSEMAWCPECCLAPDGGCYHRLLWSVRDVTVCPHHLRPLRTGCPECGESQRTVPLVPYWYLCDACGADLTGRGQEPSDGEVSEWQLWVARSAHRLIERTCAAGTTIPAGAFGRQMVPLWRLLSDTTARPPAHHLGVPNNLIGDWRRHRTYPSALALWYVSFRLGVPADALLLDSLPLLESLSEPARESLQLCPRQPKTKASISATIASHLAECLARPLSQAPSVKMVARELGVTDDRLRRNHPNACRTLKRRYQERIRKKTTERRQRRIETVVRACRHEIARGRYPSQRTLKKRKEVQPSDLRRPEIQSAIQLEQEKWREASAD